MNSASHSRRKSLQFLAAGFFSTTIPKLSAASDGHKTINAWAEIEADIDMVRDLIEPLWSSNELPSTIRSIEESLALKSSTISNTELERLHQQIAFDYASGDTMKTRGWILSSTEARLWALYVLTHE